MKRWFYAVIGVIILLLAGMVYAWSVMAKTISAARPEWSATALSLTFTLVMALFCIGCLLAGILAKRIKARIYILLAGVLFLAGFFLASLTGASILSLYLGFGILCGIASGFCYNAVMSTMSAWFPDKQGLISGILLMGFGLSAFLVGKLFAAAAPPTGDDAWKMTFRMMGIIIFVILMVCSIFVTAPPENYAPASDGNQKKKEGRAPALDIGTGEMMKKVSFWPYYIWAVLLSVAGLALVSQASGIAAQVGSTVSAGTIATVVGLISILNGIGRVIFGTMYDKGGYRPTMAVVMIGFLVTGLILLTAIRTGSFGLIILGFVCGGFSYGGVTPTNSALISDFYGRTHYSMNFSVINTNLLIASFGSTIAGRLYDRSGSYVSTILMMIFVTVAGFAVYLGIRRPKKA